MNKGFLLIACLFLQCGSKDPDVVAPTISAAEPENITPTSASITVTVTSTQADKITLRGICWSQSSNPSLTSQSGLTQNGSGAGTFTAEMTGLDLKKYYVRPYVRMGDAVFYGNEVTVSINALAPTITTVRTANTGLTGLELRTTVAYTHTAPITEKGICWSTTANVSLTIGTKIADAGGGLTFDTSIGSLAPWTAYYVRGYAITDLGVFYSEVSQFVIIPPIAYGQVTDFDGNSYRTIVINNKEWMADNLRVTHYNDGETIFEAVNQDQFRTTASGSYVAYEVSPSNASTYGYLYNEYVVNTDKVCMTGWHMPTNSEWSALANSLGGMGYAGKRMKALSSWSSPNLADNESGFNALAGGSYCRVCSSNAGIFADQGTDGYWWSSSSGSFYYCTNDLTSLRTKSTANVNDGLSIRCVKD